MDYANPYTKFAAAYDRMMENVDYVRWTNYMVDLFTYYKRHPRKVLDLACGTGSVTIPLAQRGYEMWGLDRAEEMLEGARQKAEKHNLKVNLVQGDMRNFTLPEQVDAVICLYDSINYALSEEELIQVFNCVHNVLVPDGLFIFDVTTERNIVKHFHLQTFAGNEEKFSYIWKNIYSHRDKICRTTLTFFLRDNDHYRRYIELHLQKIFEVDEIKKALEQTGYKLLSAYDTFTFNRWHRNSDRINFTACKSKDD